MLVSFSFELFEKNFHVLCQEVGVLPSSLQHTNMEKHQPMPDLCENRGKKHHKGWARGEMSLDFPNGLILNLKLAAGFNFDGFLLPSTCRNRPAETGRRWTPVWVQWPCKDLWLFISLLLVMPLCIQLQLFIVSYNMSFRKGAGLTHQKDTNRHLMLKRRKSDDGKSDDGKSDDRKTSSIGQGTNSRRLKCNSEQISSKLCM